MTRYQPNTPYSDSIGRSSCPKCGTQMLLARIEPDSPGHDRRTFECPQCEYAVTMVVKYK